jgi:protein-tyrosine phosphatase
MRHIDFAQVRNFRDMGGYQSTLGKTVRWGQLYRSGHLARLAGDDWQRFLDLGIGTVIDLRYPFEIERRGRVPEAEGLAYHNLSIEHRPYNQATLGADVELVPFLADRYREVALDGLVEIRTVLEVIAAAPGPVVFHCAAGKDRTGLIAAMVLSMLEVPEDEIVADFALTDLARDKFIEDWNFYNPGKPITWPGYGQAPAELMRLFLSNVNKEFGSIHGYLAEAVKIDPEVPRQLRRRLLD